MSVVSCQACGSENEPGRKFCGECGAGLARQCPACGSTNAAAARFCGECGVALGDAGVDRPPATEPSTAERRLVSVMFADLVGYTALSESRDFEDVRELQTRYFEAARTVVGRYGGTVEKFIGDAVMALWGAPTAREDDAERAVRAALDLVDAVQALAESSGVESLRVRAGVLTGEAAVALAAEGQGMVTGDLVNTASRIQGVAEPGSVLVGDSTRRATEAAIAYADAGAHELKGKSEAIPLWRALRISAQRRGETRVAGLEAPFVGRAAELRFVKDYFHSSADESRARLVSVVGVAGIGKSRLAWEFEKYIDGVAADIWWHRGRCLSYGEGIAFWALAEMVRGRAKIAEDEEAASSVRKIAAMLDEHVPDETERAWIEPRLLHLLGLADRVADDREDLFSAWRRFFELLAEQGPLVMVFEDVHWADEGLIAFVEYLLDWGRHHPIFVVTLARPELADRHPSFPGSTRSAATLPLEPLEDGAMDELLTGLVPGLPEDVRDRLRAAADGIPLYAVETVRMLRDRGVLTLDDGEVRVAGDLAAFEVPETLHALIASRLDGVATAERRLLQDASVLGKTFTRRGLAALSGLPDDDVERLVASLIRKELLAIETDPFSPERGQLGFLQALVQRVTYETIARRDRRGRHLAAARYLSTEAGIDPDEIAEVIALHYLDAHEADPDADDADAVRTEARRWFTRAADRAASLAASFEAQRSFERAAGLAVDESERGISLARAGELAWTGGRTEEAERLLVEAIEILQREGRSTDAASAEVRLGEVLFITDRIAAGVDRLESALLALETAENEEGVADVSAQLGRLLFFEGRVDEAAPHVERALELAERLDLAPVVVEALVNKALILQRRPNESIGLMRQALVLAEERGIDRGAIRACMNLSYLHAVAGRMSESEDVLERGLVLARRRGDRVWEQSLMTNLISGHYLMGRWDDAERLVGELPEEGRIARDGVQATAQLLGAEIALYRGQHDRAAEFIGDYANWERSENLQSRTVGAWARALLALNDGRHAAVVELCLDELRDADMTWNSFIVCGLLDLGGGAAVTLGEVDALAELVELSGASGDSHDRSFRAHLGLHRARLAALRGAADPGFEAAVAELRSLGELFWLGTALLEWAEWTVARGSADRQPAVLDEAREIFTRLRIGPTLERIDRLTGTGTTTVDATAFG